MLSDSIRLCSASRAHAGIARKVLGAFPAPWRQLHRRASALRVCRNEVLVTGKSNRQAVKNRALTVMPCVPGLRSGRTAMDGAQALYSFIQVFAAS